MNFIYLLFYFFIWPGPTDIKISFAGDLLVIGETGAPGEILYRYGENIQMPHRNNFLGLVWGSNPGHHKPQIQS